MAMFNQEPLIKSFFKTSAYELEKLNKGLTNDNYLITIDHQRFVLRIPKSDSAKIVNFVHEAKALELAKKADLDVNTLYYDPKTGIKITQYVDDLKTYSEYQGSDKLVRTAALMKRLHGLKTPIGYDFDPISRYRQYRSYVKKPLIEDAQASAIIDALKDLKYVPTLCHNDWVSGNIGFSQHKDVLIDYEYAGDNDPFFDVMSFITENDIPAEDRQTFYDAYFDHPLSPQEQHRLSVYEDFHNLLWCTWALMMFESREDRIYEMIAQDKLRQLKRKKG
jgi:thiamine kinase-like enzyme